MVYIYKSPEIPNWSEIDKKSPLTIFLAGTIDMGSSRNWQKDMEDYLKSLKLKEDLLVFNPRRDDWDSSWEQSIENKVFKQQVKWELIHIQDANIVIFNFLASSQSPITLFELGLASQNLIQEVHVICPKGFYRRGNVEIYCQHFGMKLYDSEQEFKEKFSIQYQ